MDKSILSFLLGVVVLLTVTIISSNAEGNTLARGYNEDINWVTLEEGERIAKEESKPILILIHKTWCKACKALKPKLAHCHHIEELSRHFVMVNLEDEEEPKDEMYKPDGGYIPRILFTDFDGVVRKDVYNYGGNDKYKYYYSDKEPIISAMKRALATISGITLPSDEL